MHCVRTAIKKGKRFRQSYFRPLDPCPASLHFQPSSSSALRAPFIAMLDRIAFSLFLLVILLTPTSYAFWIFDHGPLVQDRVDPILTPGGVGPHVHTIIGASNFRPTLDISTMSTSNCSTAPVQADMRQVTYGSLSMVFVAYGDFSFTAITGHHSCITEI
jgi:hypothetical protein